MGVGAQGGIAHAREERREGRGRREADAQGERVDEEADEAFQLGARAVGDRGADDDVVLAA